MSHPIKRHHRSESPDQSERRTRPRLEEPDPDPSLPGDSLPLPSLNPTNAKPPPPFQKPLPLLTFSYTSSPRTLKYDDSSLRYYVEPPLNAQLSYGYDRWVRRPDEKGRLDSLLWAWARARGLPTEDVDPSYSHNSDTTHGIGVAKGMQVGVVTWRGVMTKIITAPYEEREGWEMNAMCVNGTLYFEEHLSRERLKEKNDMEPRHRLQSYYGYAFESYCTSDTPGRAPQDSTNPHPAGWGGDVDTNAQWCSIIKTKLGNTRIVIGGEVDCVRGRFNKGTDNFVELKTSMTIRGYNDEVKFEKKLLKFYFQSFLLGVPEIVVGFRTPYGHVQTIQSLKTVKIPSMIRGKPHAWDPSLCLNWGNAFIGFVQDVIAHSKEEEEDEGAVWRIKFTPKVGISVVKLERDEVRMEVEGGDHNEGGAAVERVGFLPKAYFELEKREATAHARGCSGNGTPSSTSDRGSVPLGQKLLQSSLSTANVVAGWQI